MVDIPSFEKVFYLVPGRGFKEGLLLLETDVDVLGMCSTQLMLIQRRMFTYILIMRLMTHRRL